MRELEYIEQRLPAFHARKYEVETWDGGPGTGDDIEWLTPTGYVSSRMPRKERKGPEYLPVPSSKYTGKVTYFNAERNFGKIGRRIFFHVSEVKDGNASYIREGVTVAYEEGVDARDGREKAVDVQLVPERG